jgi:hypothetical protein
MRRAILLALLASVLIAGAAAAAPPSITPNVTGQPGDGGWYVGDVIVNWSIAPAGYLVDFGCAPATSITTDTTGRKVECQASIGTDTAYSSVTVRLDKTPPVVVAAPDRVSDAGGFYNHALSLNWSVSDPTSGVASCSPGTTYSGPDGTHITLTGTCRDRAGNVSAPVPFVFDYDATPPVVSKVTASIGKKTATVAWEVTGATTITLIRASASAPTRQRTVYAGSGSRFTDRGLVRGRHYTYIVRAADAAGNVASRSMNVTPGSTASSDRLLAPRANAKLRKPPLLRWREVRKARYYNVQVFRKGKKILSAWPSKPHYQLRRTWRYRGRRHRLADATYHWYLWAGYGKRSAHHYGNLLGQRSFVVR